MLVMIAGPSGVGKNTIINELQKRNKNIEFIRSCTSRERRLADRDDQYFFLTREEFEKKIKNGEFFEYEMIHGNYMGTLAKTIEEIIEGKKVFIKDFGVLGQKNFAKELKDKAKILSIFLDCKDDELIRRLTERGEKEIKKRSERFEFERGFKENFDVVIENTDLEKTIQIIEEKIKNTLK